MVLTWNCRAAVQCTVSTTFPQHRDSSLDTCRYTDNDVRLNGKYILWRPDFSQLCLWLIASVSSTYSHTTPSMTYTITYGLSQIRSDLLSSFDIKQFHSPCHYSIHPPSSYGIILPPSITDKTALT
jgi:hypothetical protein